MSDDPRPDAGDAGEDGDASDPTADLGAWVVDQAVGIARLADSPAAADDTARRVAGTLSPAASRAISEASRQPTGDSPAAEHDDAGTVAQADPETALAALDRAVAGTRVLGLGHTVPGTHELATLAGRIAEHLAGEGGATVLAIHASASTTTALDDYVRGGDGDPVDVLDRLGRRSWRTREGVAFLEALRRINLDRPPEQRVRVIGFDPVLPASSVLAVSRVLRATAPGTFEAVAPDMAGLVTPASVDRLRAAVDTAAAALDDPAVAGACDPDELAEARRHLPLLRRAAEYVAAGDDAPAVHARLIAEAVLEAAAAAPASAAGPAVLLWGHADHVLVGDDPVPTAGHHLRAALGQEYYALGLVGASGEFRALRYRKRRGPSRSLRVHRFSAAPGLAVTLVAAVASDHLVDLRAARGAAPAVTAWCEDPTSIRVLGEVVPRSVDQTPSRPVVPAAAADGWATVARVRPATPR